MFTSIWHNKVYYFPPNRTFNLFGIDLLTQKLLNTNINKPTGVAIHQQQLFNPVKLFVYQAVVATKLVYPEQQGSNQVKLILVGNKTTKVGVQSSKSRLAIHCSFKNLGTINQDIKKM